MDDDISKFDWPVSRSGSNAKRPTGYDVFRWPEFVALAKRLGISATLPIKQVSINLHVGESVTVDVKYFADDMKNDFVEDIEGISKEQTDDIV